MTKKERVLNALERKPTDRVPFNLGFGINPPVRKELAAYLGKPFEEVDGMLESLRDIQYVRPEYRGPKDRVCVTDGKEIDFWGVPRRSVSYGPGSYYEISEFILGGIESVEELEHFIFPDTSWFDYDSIPAQIKKINEKEEHAICFTAGNMFETSWYMRGFEQAFMDMHLNPELLNAIMNKATDFFIANAECVLKSAKGLIDIAFTADDIAGQNGLLCSLPMWEEFIKPYHVKLNEFLHSYNVKIMYHSDGAVMKALDGLVDMGIDILEALQFDAAGMDPAIMKQQYGDRLCFHGGISVQKTLPFGSPEDVWNEVKARIEVLGNNGGYIAAPSHAVQAGTPPQNVLSFIEAATGIKLA